MRNEIICPHCKKAFKVDDTAFAEILKQVRDSEFEQALHEQVANAVKIANLEAQTTFKVEASQKDMEIAKLQAKIEAADDELSIKLKDKDNEAKLEVSQTRNLLQEDLAKKDSEIAGLKAVKEASLAKMQAEKDAEIAKLQANLKEKEDEVKLVESQTKNALQENLSKKSEEIAALQQMLETKDIEKDFAVTEALNKVEKERDELMAKLREKEDEAKLIESQTKNLLQEDLSKRNAEIVALQAEKDALLTKVQTEKDTEIASIQAKLDAAETAKKMAISEAVTRVEKERDELSAKLDSSATQKELAVSKAVNVVEKERDELAGKLEVKEHEQKLLESSLKEKHKAELELKDEQIAQYKDFKAKQSVKLLGESLEQHCEIAFRQWQSTGAFRNVYFEKDNDDRTGGKGDYVYRETDEAGNEILSIMFDMKNEADETATKKKNEDYFKKLNKDRTNKKCEYAVLVSVLEAESELYAGITDVSYVYDKMYVIRPQFFIPIITLLRNGALESLKYKAQLAFVRNQNIDITSFENDLLVFQDGFMKNIKDSSNKFQDAMDGIDSTIKKLESIKEALRLSNKHLLTAGNKVENVSVKRLTKNNPTMAAKFEELKKDDK